MLELVGLGGPGDAAGDAAERRPAAARGARPRAGLRAGICCCSTSRFSNLDAKLREQMRVELKRLQQRLGITVLFVTHDQIEAMSLSTGWR